MAHSLECKPRTKDVILEDNVTFESLFLQRNVLKGLKENGFRKPSPIQLRAIPIGRCGFDLIVKSKSGTGKTLVFSIIALESVKLEKSAVQVLILVPAREIAVQIQDVLKNIGKYLEGLQVESFIGGLPVNVDKQKCQACHIAVGTPGRIKQLIKEKHLNPDSISLFILDEADKLMESSFQNDINEIYNMLPNKKQLITTSATYPNQLSTFLSNYMLSPTEVTVEVESPLLLGLKHFVSVVKCHPNVVQQTKIKNEHLLQILSNVSFTQCLVFSNYQTRAESISNMLKKHGWNATFISAAQSQKERLEAINSLKDFKCRILLSTDLTARGIDASNVNLVINYDIPIEPMTYLHRMGRAGRYGSLGICINLASEGSELKLLQTILGVIGGTNMSIPKLPKLTAELDLHGVVSSDPDKLIFGIVPEENSSSDKIKDEILQLKAQAKHEKKSKNENSSENAVEGIVTNNPDVDKSCKDNENEDCQSILKALASGNLQDSSVTSLFDEENVHRHQLNMVDTKSLLETMASGNKITLDLPECSKSSLVTKIDDLQNLIISGDDKKRKRVDNVSGCSSTTDLKETKKQNHQNDVYCKNMALFNVAKIVSNCGDMKNSAGTLEKYLEMLRDEEKSVAIEDTKVVLENLKDCQTVMKEDLIKDVQDVHNNYLENIFLTTYKSFIDSDCNNWKSCVPKGELDKFEQLLLNPDQSEDEAEFEDYYEEDYDMDEEYNSYCDNDEEPREEQIVEQNSNMDASGDYNFMKWIPVEKGLSKETKENRNGDDDEEEEIDVKMVKSDKLDKNSDGNYHFMKWVPSEKTDSKVSRTQAFPQQECLQNADKAVEKYEQFQNYYEGCSDTLWQNGLSFENVSDFDDWFFYEWQAQVSAVRNYVQQNVYVQEMARVVHPADRAHLYHVAVHPVAARVHQVAVLVHQVAVHRVAVQLPRVAQVCAHRPMRRCPFRCRVAHRQ